MTNRNSIVSPGTTLPLVVSQAVPPPRRLLEPQYPGSLVNCGGGLTTSNPVPVRPAVDEQVDVVPATAPEAQPVLPFLHVSNKPVLPCARPVPIVYTLLFGAV